MSTGIDQANHKDEPRSKKSVADVTTNTQTSTLSGFHEHPATATAYPIVSEMSSNAHVFVPSYYPTVGAEYVGYPSTSTCTAPDYHDAAAAQAYYSHGYMFDYATSPVATGNYSWLPSDTYGTGWSVGIPVENNVYGGAVVDPATSAPAAAVPAVPGGYYTVDMYLNGIDSVEQSLSALTFCPPPDPTSFTYYNNNNSKMAAGSAGFGGGGWPRHPAPQRANRLNGSTNNAMMCEQQRSAVVEQLQAQHCYNPAQLELDTTNARFFVIKSYSEEDIHRSIKYNIWCSTDYGNKRLDAAWHRRAREAHVYLLFSVNGSGHFCGIAEMLSAVDYNRSAKVWSQDKWKGEFKVRWIYVKDVPNSQLRHIRLENNEGKPVTNSRDTQEVPADKGALVIRIIHDYRHATSIFDDFSHYEQQQQQLAIATQPPTGQPLDEPSSSSQHIRQPLSGEPTGQPVVDRPTGNKGVEPSFNAVPDNNDRPQTAEACGHQKVDSSADPPVDELKNPCDDPQMTSPTDHSGDPVDCDPDEQVTMRADQHTDPLSDQKTDQFVDQRGEQVIDRDNEVTVATDCCNDDGSADAELAVS